MIRPMGIRLQCRAHDPCAPTGFLSFFLKTHMGRAGRLYATLLLALILSACTFTAPKPTPAPIYVTATPIPIFDTPTPEGTLVLGPTPSGTEELAVFPTLAPATKTPPPSQPPSLTPSFTASFTESPVPKGTKVTLKCTTELQGGFATIFQDKTIQTALGCPVSPAIAISSASLNFENGSMLWASQYADIPTKAIYALYNNGTYQRFDDNWFEGKDPETTGEIPPAGKNTPVRGFGKVWHNNPAVKSGLGFATNTEVGTAGEIQRFEHGEMLFVASLKQTFIFISGTTNTWRANGTPF